MSESQADYATLAREFHHLRTEKARIWAQLVGTEAEAEELRMGMGALQHVADERARMIDEARAKLALLTAVADAAREYVSHQGWPEYKRVHDALAALDAEDDPVGRREPGEGET